MEIHHFSWFLSTHYTFFFFLHFFVVFYQIDQIHTRTTCSEINVMFSPYFEFTVVMKPLPPKANHQISKHNINVWLQCYTIFDIIFKELSIPKKFDTPSIPLAYMSCCLTSIQLLYKSLHDPTMNLQTSHIHIVIENVDNLPLTSMSWISKILFILVQSFTFLSDLIFLFKIIPPRFNSKSCLWTSTWIVIYGFSQPSSSS